MEAGASTQQLAQAATTKSSKSKSKKATSVVSQYTTVVITTKSKPEGSAWVVVSGEGKDEHQRSPRNKELKVSMSENQPSYIVSSQKDTIFNK